MDFLTLDIGGVVLAVVLGVMFAVLGGSLGPFFLLVMIVFLLLSALVTWVGMRRKKKLGLGQGPRGIKNVLANGVPPVLMVVLFYIFSKTGNGTMALLSAIGFLGSVAAITADKFGSEIGVLNGMPHMIFTMRHVRKGTSGGITLLGLLAGLVAAIIVASTVLIASGLLGTLNGAYKFSIAKAVISVALAGFAGNLIDSALGYYEEKGFGNKFTSNFICGVAAGFVAMLIFIVL